MKKKIVCISIFVLVFLTFLPVTEANKTISGGYKYYLAGRIKDLVVNDDIISYTCIKVYCATFKDGRRTSFGHSYYGCYSEWPTDEYKFYGILKEPFIWGIIVQIK